jgi:transcription elongation GreA/GreB family factor
VSELSKKQILEQIRTEILRQISATEKAVEQAREGFRVGDDRAENRGERGAIQEKSWLLSAQAARLEELNRQLYAVDHIELQALREVSTGALVWVEDPAVGEKETYLVHPELGGMEVSVGGRPLLAISPASPLGAALFGRKPGDAIEVELPAAVRKLTIVEVE